MNKFVIAKREINANGRTVNKYEVGIVTLETENEYTVQFVLSDAPITLLKNDVNVFEPQKTGDLFDYKVCNRCHRLLPVDNFQINQTGKDNRIVRRPSCNDCRDEIDGTDIPSDIRNEWEKQKPSYEIWECPICKKKTIPGLTSKVVLDHDHETGMPRAWICDSCNTGLGRFKDNIETIEYAIKYLKDE